MIRNMGKTIHNGSYATLLQRKGLRAVSLTNCHLMVFACQEVVAWVNGQFCSKIKGLIVLRPNGTLKNDRVGGQCAAPGLYAGYQPAQSDPKFSGRPKKPKDSY